ncbi:hypothetical protein VNO77_18557 [Canavalia gladiata]|uniref:Uncharacterized protein n=1 Tax=Canavalia gladiata TaxID=3824 RepID=A0AAN9LPQ7_CANGL
MDLSILSTPSFPLPFNKTLPKPTLPCAFFTTLFHLSSKNFISSIFPVVINLHSQPFIVSNDTPQEECSIIIIYGDLESFCLCYLVLHGVGIVTVDDTILQFITSVALVSDVLSWLLDESVNPDMLNRQK